MKMLPKMIALGIAGLGLSGCAADDDKAVTVTATGKKGTEGKLVPQAPRSSRDAYDKGKNSNDMLKNKDYSGAGR